MTKNTHTPHDAHAARAAETATGAEDSVSADVPGGAARQPMISGDDSNQAAYTDQAIMESSDSIRSELVSDARIQQLQADLAEAGNQVLRAHAELDNYRKRAHRLLEAEKKYAPLPLMRDLLPVLDNLERAIQSAEQDEGAAGLLEGVKMVAQQLHGVLQRHHCTLIEAQGAVFDPHVHEAIAQLPNEQVPPGTVIEVALPGYRLHDRVVRPSQVLVSARPAGPIS